MHAYNYTSFSLPSVVAANTMSPTDKARYNQERVDLHFQLIDDEDAREEDFLIVVHTTEIQKEEERLFKLKHRQKLETTGKEFGRAEAKQARAEARLEAAAAETAGTITHHGRLKERELERLKILHEGYKHMFLTHCEVIGDPTFQAFVCSVFRHNFICEAAFKTLRDQLVTARNKGIPNCENVVLVKTTAHLYKTRGVTVTVQRGTDSESSSESDEEETSTVEGLDW